MPEVASLNNITALLMIVMACLSDLKTKSVSNRMILVFFSLSIVLVMAQMGFSGLWWIASSFAASIVIALPLYLMKIFGGGDFKLLIAISPLLHWRSVILMIAAALVWGAILGLIRVVLQGELKQVLQNLRDLANRSQPARSQLHMIPFTFAIFFGFLSQLSLNQMGWEWL